MIITTDKKQGEGQFVNHGKDSCPAPYVQASDVFSIADVAHMLKVPQSRLRKWSHGYKVVRQVRASSLETSSDTYSLYEVYLFAVLNYLHAHRLPKAAIEYVLNEIFVESELPYVFFHFEKQHAEKWGQGELWGLRWGLLGELPWEEAERKEELPALRPTLVYDLDLRALVGWVNGRIAKRKCKQ